MIEEDIFYIITPREITQSIQARIDMMNDYSTG